MNTNKNIHQVEIEALLNVLKERFEKNMHRHPELVWTSVEKSILKAPSVKIIALQAMENTEGEPDVVQFNNDNQSYTFYDCAIESPKGRRSLCYDKAAFDARKENKPVGSALEMAKTMGISILTESEYRYLQTLGKFDLKTSSWIKTPDNIRKLDGALFGDRRYDHVFVYHNGAQSYYAARGFRGSLEIECID